MLVLAPRVFFSSFSVSLNGILSCCYARIRAGCCCITVDEVGYDLDLNFLKPVEEPTVTVNGTVSQPQAPALNKRPPDPNRMLKPQTPAVNKPNNTKTLIMNGEITIHKVDRKANVKTVNNDLNAADKNVKNNHERISDQTPAPGQPALPQVRHRYWK